jgi:hypothetical protein
MMLLTRRTLAAVAAFGLVASASAANGPAEQENYDDANVITLTSTDFSDVGSLPTPMLVDFYAYAAGPALILSSLPPLSVAVSVSVSLCSFAGPTFLA